MQKQTVLNREFVALGADGAAGLWDVMTSAKTLANRTAAMVDLLAERGYTDPMALDTTKSNNAFSRALYNEVSFISAASTLSDSDFNLFITGKRDHVYEGLPSDWDAGCVTDDKGATLTPAAAAKIHHKGERTPISRQVSPYVALVRNGMKKATEDAERAQSGDGESGSKDGTKTGSRAGKGTTSPEQMLGKKAEELIARAKSDKFHEASAKHRAALVDALEALRPILKEIERTEGDAKATH